MPVDGCERLGCSLWASDHSHLLSVRFALSGPFTSILDISSAVERHPTYKRKGTVRDLERGVEIAARASKWQKRYWSKMSFPFPIARLSGWVSTQRSDTSDSANTDRIFANANARFQSWGA